MVQFCSTATLRSALLLETGSCDECCDVLVDFDNVDGLNVSDALIVGECNFDDRQSNTVIHLDRTVMFVRFDVLRVGIQICCSFDMVMGSCIRGLDIILCTLTANDDEDV